MKTTLVSVLVLLVPIQPCRADDKTLAERLAPLAKAHRGKVAIAVKHLGNGETYFLDADEEMPTASLIKFMIMLETYFQVSEGKVKLEDKVVLRKEDMVPGSGILTYHFSDGATFPLRDAVRLMMVYSDNTATNLVLDKIGLASTNKRMDLLGCPKTRLNAKVFKASTTSLDKERTRKFGLGSTSARETVLLLEKVHRGEIVSADVCKEMLGHMKKCEDRTKLKRFLPANIEVAHKSGAVSDAKTDAGILCLPGGPVAVCVLTAQNADKEYKDDNAAHIFIGRVAEQIHEHFAVKKKK